MDTQTQIKNCIDKNFLNENNSLQIISSENYMKVLKENQTKIIEIDRDYVQKFVKIGSYLKSTQKNIFNIFERILKNDFNNIIDVSQYIESDWNLDSLPLKVMWIIREELYGNEPIPDGDRRLKFLREFCETNKSLILQNGVVHLPNKNYEPTLLKLNQHIISYQSLVISSFKMIKSLSEDDMITFYELYEVFDKLGIFDTQWQKSMLEKIGDLTSSLDEVSNSLKNINSTIKDGLDNISSDLMMISTDITSGFDSISFDIRHIND